MNRRPLVLSILVGVLISVVWYMFVWSPKQTDLKDSRSEHAAAENDTTSLKAELSHLEDIDRQGPKIDAEVLRLQTYVPKSPELASFLLTANQLALDSGIEWLSITPSDPTVDPAGGPTVITIQVEVEGGFSEVLKYLDGLEKLPRLVIVDSLSLAGGGEVGASDAGAAATEESVDANGAPTIKTSFTARMFTDAVPAGAAVDGVSLDDATTPTTTATTSGEGS